MSLNEFIALDFETANRNRHSICSVGLVFVEDGEIIDSIYSLINPEEEFDGYNVMIHGITSKDVKTAPTFDEFYNSIRYQLEGRIITAHYMPFDGYALRDNIRRYNIDSTSNDLLCTYQLARELIPRQSSYSLKSLCHLYGIKLEDHHHALADAKACAELMIKLMNEFQLKDLNSIYKYARIKHGNISVEGYRPSLVHSTSLSKLNLSHREVSEDVEGSSDLYGKNIAFTGRLESFTRREAAKLVASKGGRPQSGINRQTNYIILGDFENVMIKGNKSSKLKQAEKMIANGHKLEIISEEDFLKMI